MTARKFWLYLTWRVTMVLGLALASSIATFASVGNTILIAALAGFSALLSIFFGVYQSRISRRQLLAAESGS